MGEHNIQVLLAAGLDAGPAVGEHNILAGAVGTCPTGDVEMAFVAGVQVPAGRSSHFVAGIVNVMSHYSL